MVGSLDGGNQAERPEERGWWPTIHYLRRRRPILTAIIVLAAPLHTLWSGTPPFDLLSPSTSLRFVIPWVLIVLGIGVRLWGAGNLRKSQEITDRGIYRFVRHPLYLGSLAFFLAYFATVGDLSLGIFLFIALLFGVYYPTMLSEEHYLIRTFPEQYANYDPPPRLFPDPRRVSESLSSDRFSARMAYENLGFRSLWFAIGLPLFLRVLAFVQTEYLS